MEFRKMHSLGNDFVIVDSRETGSRNLGVLACMLGDRHRGIGFDQLVEITTSPNATARLDFWNADGSVSATCGNATRCVARLLLDETGATEVTLETGRGALQCEDAGDALVRANMGLPQLAWDEIPLARQTDTLHLPLEGDPCAVGMGNPHCVFFVEDAASVDLERRGREWECHALFPKRANVEFVSVTGRDKIRMRIWERGVGPTQASGSGSCASAVAAARRGLTARSVTVETDGGELAIDWRDDGVWMTGPTSDVFTGHVQPQIEFRNG